MSTPNAPLVSVLTPVYNGAEHLRDCIESVLAQSYSNWRYTLVDNCSTDQTLAIAREYAARDPRIRVVPNTQFLRIIENHNRTLQHLERDSKYCKFVFADDTLSSTCIEEMVQLAERNSSVGIVGAYTTDGESVLWPGPSTPSECVSGKEVCRSMLHGGPFLLGTMTSLMVRADLIRKRQPFFNIHNLHADTEAYYDVLRESDYGFIHKVLCLSRKRPRSTGSFAHDYDSIHLSRLLALLKYGTDYLEPSEYQMVLHRKLEEYHRKLAHNVLRGRPRSYWRYHEGTLKAFGSGIDRWLLLKMLIRDVGQRLRRPRRSLRQGFQWWSRAATRGFSDTDSMPVKLDKSR